MNCATDRIDQKKLALGRIELQGRRWSYFELNILMRV
jgi:hypothetical protein